MYFIKVDRVSSVAEAMELQKLGVNCIGISLLNNDSFSDKRNISSEEAKVIRQALSESKLSIELEYSSNEFQEKMFIIEEIRPDFVQFNLREPIVNTDLHSLEELGCEVIYSGLEASYDDDPSWVLSSFENLKGTENNWFQLDLLPDIENSWEFLKEECPKYPEELQMSDIDELAEDYKLIVTSSFSEQDIDSIIDYLPNISGIAFVLCNDPKKKDANYFEYENLESILTSF